MQYYFENIIKVILENEMHNIEVRRFISNRMIAAFIKKELFFNQHCLKKSKEQMHRWVLASVAAIS